MKKTRIAWISTLTSFFLFTLLAKAQVDPSIEWKVMHLPHFELIYDAKHQELANIYADRLEDNLQFLKQYFEFFPETTTVVLNDQTDLTNGYATSIPYRLIMAYPVLPGPMESISDYGDWERELTLHEFTHILSFEPRRGLVKGLYYTFGSIVTPNLLLPRWWLEGVAVDMETRTSEKGRLRSAYQDGAIRSYVSEERLSQINLPQINETAIHTWPQGARPYLFGSLMWSEMISRYGKDLIKKLHWRYGGRFPFVIDGPLKDETGLSYNSMYKQMIVPVEAKARQQLDQLQKVPPSQGPQLEVKNGVENFSPVISPDGLKMIFLSKDDTTKRSVRILERSNKTQPFEGSQEFAEIRQKLDESLQDSSPLPRKFQNKYGIDENRDEEGEDGPPGGTIQRLAWFPDSKKFIFDKVDTVNRFQEFSDLWVYDMEKKKSEQITFAARAREASVSPDGRAAVFVFLDAGTTRLGRIDLVTHDMQTLYVPIKLQTRLSYPTYLNEDEIVFSERVNGKETLKLYNLNRQTGGPILSEFPQARLPLMTGKGLIFTSTLNGVSNIYLASSDLKSAKPFSHSRTHVGVSTFDSDRKELYATELTSQGYQIRRWELAPLESLPAKLPVIEPLLADRYPPVAHEVAPLLGKYDPESYSAWPYILPRYWLPQFYASSDSTLVGASVSSSDPLGKHAYSLAASYDTQPKETSLNFIYENNQTSALILVKAMDYNTNVVNTGSRYRLQDYEVDSLWQMTGLSPDLYAGVGWNWQSHQFSGLRTEAQGPMALISYLDYTMAGAQISPEAGQAINLSATSFQKSKALANESYVLYQYSLQKYFSKWLPRHNAILLRIQGQRIEGETNIASSAFSVPYAPFQNTPSPFYVMRGYLNGQFLGKSLTNGSFEYRFPIAYPYKGWGTAPFFLKRLHAAVVGDMIQVDGYSYNKGNSVYDKVEKDKNFGSAGAEVKADVTLGYHFPLTFFMGYYWPLDKDYKEGEQFALGLQL